MTTVSSRLESLLTLNLTEGIGAVLAARLEQAFGSLEAAVAAPAAALERVPGIGPVLSRAIAATRDQGLARRELDEAARLGIRILTADDPDFPEPLRATYDPPIVLYARGTLLPADALAVAVVGTRNPTPYGRAQAERFGRDLAAAGLTVVSGLARGVDAAAHAAALDAGGRTLAVLGSGLTRIYPTENEDLARRIVGQGALLAEVNLRASPDAKNFPRRNRIVSGLSLGVLVIEAGRKSGTLITVAQALDQGREVFAVPGRVDSENSTGCHALIRQGAKLVETVEDVLEELGPYRDRLRPVAATPGKEGPSLRPQPLGGLPLSPTEEILVNALSPDPLHIDEVIRGTGLPAGAVLSGLLTLELKRKVRQDPGKYFARV